MPSKGKAKGNSWEREISAYLGNLFELHFQRVPNSGAFLGGSNASRRTSLDSKQERLMTGDIIVPEELNHLSIECKFYKTFDYHLIYSQNKQFEEWVKQAMDGCNPNQLWFLCIKANRRDPIVAFSSSLFLEYLTAHNYSCYNIGDKLIYITDLKKFFEFNKDLLLTIGK